MMNEKRIKKIFEQFDRTSMPDREKILSNCDNAFNGKKTAYPVRRPQKLAFAAILASLFLVASTLTIGAFVVENQRYEEAVEFFEKNGLSAEEYSRSEVKRIYKDITSNSFSYHLTFEAICDSIGISGEELSEEEIKNLWEKKDNIDSNFEAELLTQGIWVSGEAAEDGVSLVFKVDVANAESIDDTYTILEKYSDGELEWKKEIKGVSVSKVVHANGVIIAAGAMRNNEGDRGLICFSESGEELWRVAVETYNQIIIEEDMITVIGNGFGDNMYPQPLKTCLYIAEFDFNGKRLRAVSEAFSSLGFENIRFAEYSYQSPAYSISKALKVGENYYLLIEADIRVYTAGSDTISEATVKRQMGVAKVSSDGTFEALYEVNEPMKSHRITDIAVKDGELYLCGYYMNSSNGPLDNGLLLGETEELDSIKGKLLEANGETSNAELVEMLRAYYTGFFIKCDIETGTVSSAKMLEGVKNGGFSLKNNGELVLGYELIADAKYSIKNNSWEADVFEPYADIDIIYTQKELQLS